MKINEGTWALKIRRANTMIRELEKLEKRWWNIIGDDILYDKIDGAIDRIKQLQRTAARDKVNPQIEDDEEFPIEEEPMPEASEEFANILNESHKHLQESDRYDCTIRLRVQDKPRGRYKRIDT